MRLQQTNIIAKKTHPFSSRKYICKTLNFCCLARLLEDFVNRQIAHPVPGLRCRSADEKLQRWEYWDFDSFKGEKVPFKQTLVVPGAFRDQQWKLSSSRCTFKYLNYEDGIFAPTKLQDPYIQFKDLSPWFFSVTQRLNQPLTDSRTRRMWVSAPSCTKWAKRNGRRRKQPFETFSGFFWIFRAP